MSLVAAAVAAAAAWSLCGLPLGSKRSLPMPTLRIGQMAAASALTAAVALTVVGHAIALVVAVAASALPGAIEQARRQRERRDRADSWPDLLATIRGRLGAGDDVPDAIVAAACGPLAELGAAVTAGRRRGLDLTSSLEPVRRQWADPTADRVILTLAAATRAGGSRVADVVTRLGESVADELRLRRAHDAETTQQRLTAAVALVAPWALLVFTITTNPQAATAFDGPAGSAIIWAGGAATGLGYVLARRTVTLSATPRVFR